MLPMDQAASLCLFLLLMISSAASHCPIWFREVADGSCECGDDLGGLIKCDKGKQIISIAMNYCMTYDNTSQELQTGFCGYKYRKNSNDYKENNRAYIALPKDKTELNKLCEIYHLQGLLCGQCEKEYGVVINSFKNHCIKCRGLHTVALSILLMILPITVYFALVIMLHLNLASGKFLGYILFCQGFVVGTRMNSGIYYSIVNSMGTYGRFALNFSLSLSGVWWYSQTFFYISKPLCFHKTMTGLQVVLLEYIYVVYPLFLIFVSWICTELHAKNYRVIVNLWKPFHRCLVKIRRKWSVSDSIVHAYATFFFLSFWSLTFASLSLLYSTPVWNMNGTTTSRVLVFDPSVESFSPEHLPYAITAIVLLFFFGLCPTMFLCLYHTRLFTKCCPLGTRAQLAVHIFVDTFDSCYKDGVNERHNFRLLSSVPMWLILLMVPLGIIYGLQTFQWHIYLLALFCFVILSLSGTIAYIRPFKLLYMNFSVTFHFAVGAFLSGIAVIWLEGHIMTDHSLAIAYTSLAMLPHIFALATLGYDTLEQVHFVRTMFHKLLCITSAFFFRQHEGVTESLPHRLENSNIYQTLPNLS